MEWVALFLKLCLMLFDWQQNNTINTPNLNVDINEFLPANLIKGTIAFTETSVTGFESIPYHRQDPGMFNASFEDNFGNNNVCLKNFTINNFQFTTNYDAKLFVLDFIPVRKKGTFNLEMKNVTSEMCFYLISDFNNTIESIDNYDIHIKYKYRPISLTGMTNNPENDKALNLLLNKFNILLSVWPKGAECFFSPIIQFMANAYLGNVGNLLKNDPFTCLLKESASVMDRYYNAIVWK